MTDVQESTWSEAASGSVRSIEEGKASFPDVALLVMVSNLARKIGRADISGDPGA
jgi:hypothetical protein